MTSNQTTDNDTIRIGVFICHCGSNIGHVIDCPNLTKYAKSLPSVVFSQDNLYTCSETGLNEIKKGIREHNLNRVVVAACTPRTHEPLFRSICVEMGLNPYQFEFVNIREQCSWVHQKNQEKAQEKAQDLLRMGVARAANLESLSQIQIDVVPSCLVIGGGIAGMNASLSLANQGFKVFLIEKTDKLGGLLNSLYRLYPNNIEVEKILSITSDIKTHKKIQLFLNAEIINIEGFIGNFKTKIMQSGEIKEIESGGVVVATGAQVLDSPEEFNKDQPNIITHLELERLLREDNIQYKNIVIIQCAGSRTKNRPYCSSICCMTALKNARILKMRHPEANIIILYRDLHISGTYQETYYRDIRKLGVLFMRYSEENLPIIETGRILCYNQSLDVTMELPYDLVVLSTPLIPQEGMKTLSQMLKVPIEENGFFLEAHVKLRPVDFSNDGIFVCGAAKWPCNVSEAISQGLAVAARAARILSKSKVIVEGAVAEIDNSKCIGCGICISLCPYGAIAKDDQENVIIRTALCKGCGVCGSSCPKTAIQIKHFTNEQIYSQINALAGYES